MSDKKKPKPRGAASTSGVNAEMIALLRQKEGAPLMLNRGMQEGLDGQYAPALSSNYSPTPIAPEAMPKSPATEVAMLRQQMGDAPVRPQAMLEEGLGEPYAPARAKPMPGMGPRFQQPQGKQKVPPEVLISVLRGGGR